jgi:hypothetical protein
MRWVLVEDGGSKLLTLKRTSGARSGDGAKLTAAHFFQANALSGREPAVTRTHRATHVDVNTAKEVPGARAAPWCRAIRGA